MNLCSTCTGMLRSPECAVLAPPSLRHIHTYTCLVMGTSQRSVCAVSKAVKQGKWRIHFVAETTATVTKSSANGRIHALCLLRQVGKLQPPLFSCGCDSSYIAFLCSSLLSKHDISVFLEFLWASEQPFNKFLFSFNQPESVSIACNQQWTLTVFTL